MRRLLLFIFVLLAAFAPQTQASAPVPTRVLPKLYGPDFDGVYGGQNGTGGFEADAAADVLTLGGKAVVAGGIKTGAKELIGAAAKTGATLPADIAATFRGGKYSSRVLQSDVVAYRFSGGVSEPAGRFLTTQQTVRWIGTPDEAIRALNLPPGATAQQLNAFIIPKGTQIFYGRVEGGAQGATQIFIQDRGVLIPVP